MKKFAIVVFSLELLTVVNLSSAEIKIGRSTIEAEISGGPFQASSDRVLQWVNDSARAVTAYYGRFPVPSLQLKVRGYDGRGVRGGVAYPAPDGGRIVISVGRAISDRKLNEDWMLTHEMVHLAFPDLDDSHIWLEEGLATYVEPWARLHSGSTTPSRVWRDFIRDLPQGLPGAGDQGLDHTHTWGRTYWGGNVVFDNQAPLASVRRAMERRQK